MQELINRINIEEANGFVCTDMKDLNVSLVQLADFIAERQSLVEKQRNQQYASQLSEEALFKGNK